MANPQNLADDTPLLPWLPGNFQSRLIGDALELQASLAGEEVSVMRLQANKDVTFFGELLLDDGNVWSLGTISLTNTDPSASDVVSFRQSQAEGDEVMRISREGNQGGISQLNAGPEMSLKLLSRVATANAGAGEPAVELDTEADVTASETLLRLSSNTTSCYTFSGRGPAASVMTMRCWGPAGLKILAQDDTEVQALELEGSNVTIDSDAQMTLLSPASTSATLVLDSYTNNTTAGRKWGLVSDQSSGDLNIQVGGNTRAALNNDALLELTSPSSSSAELQLDSGNGPGGGLWGLESHRVTGDLNVKKAGSTRFAFDGSTIFTLEGASGDSPTLVLDASAATNGETWNVVSNGTTGKLTFREGASEVVLSLSTGSAIEAKYAVLFQAGGGVNTRAIASKPQ